MIAEPSTIPLGSVVAERYRLDRLIGRGGFGAVFAAADLRLPRSVALKILSSAAMAEAGGEARFRREADLASRISHPGAVRVLDSGSDPRGLHFIAFELYDGRSVDAVIHGEGPLSPKRAAAIAIDTLAALEEAHAAGVIHRDIKPANIFLVRAARSSGAEGVTEAVSGEAVKVLDFGIAKSLKPNTMGLTREGTSMGTPIYMAPEQITGQPLGPFSDLYSVGLVLAEMLLGASPYGPSPSAVAVVAERIEGKPVPFPTDLTQSPLGPVLLRATAPVKLRYARASEMRQALLALLPTLSSAPFRARDARAVLGEAPTAIAEAPGARARSPLAASLDHTPNAARMAALVGGPSIDPASKRRLEATVQDDGTRPPNRLASTVTDDAARRSSQSLLAATVLDDGGPSPLARMPPPKRRGRAVVWIVAVLLVAAAAGGAVAFLHFRA